MNTERLEIGGSLVFESTTYESVAGYATSAPDASFDFLERSPDAFYSDTETSITIDEKMARKIVAAISKHFGFVAP